MAKVFDAINPFNLFKSKPAAAPPAPSSVQKAIAAPPTPSPVRMPVANDPNARKAAISAQQKARQRFGRASTILSNLLQQGNNLGG